jgi:sulfur carrier protein ThiS
MDLSSTIKTMNIPNVEEQLVTLTYRRQTHQVKAGMTLRDSLVKLDINPESVLATRQGEMITDDVILKTGETIKLVAVISGG